MLKSQSKNKMSHNSLKKNEEIMRVVKNQSKKGMKENQQKFNQTTTSFKKEKSISKKILNKTKTIRSKSSSPL